MSTLYVVLAALAGFLTIWAIKRKANERRIKKIAELEIAKGQDKAVIDALADRVKDAKRDPSGRRVRDSKSGKSV